MRGDDLGSDSHEVLADMGSDSQEVLADLGSDSQEVRAEHGTARASVYACVGESQELVGELGVGDSGLGSDL